MKKRNQKLLSAVSVAMLVTQVFVPALGVNVADTINGVKKFTPVLDGVKDEEYNGSYSVRFSDLARAGRLDMGTFQMQEQLFYRVYEDNKTGGWSGLLTMFDNDGREITWDIFQEEFDGMYSEFVNANTYDTGKVDENTEAPVITNDVRFRWTEEGLKSKYFTDAVISFLWDDNGVYVYADVEDKDILHYGMDGSDFNELFSSGWSGRPWLVDCLNATFRIDGLPHTAYKIMNTKKDKSGKIVVDEKMSRDYTEVGVVALGNGMAYYSEPSEAVFNPDIMSVDYKNYTLLNDFCLNWWEYCYYQDSVATAPVATPMRDKICKGGDNVTEDGTVGKTCHESESDFIFRHIMTPENLAVRDEGRAENLQYLKSVTRDDGYSLEMLVPFTEEAMEQIYRNNYEVDVRLQITNAMFVKSKDGGASWSNSNAIRWTYAAMDGGDYDPPVGKPVREADGITLTLTDMDPVTPPDTDPITPPDTDPVMPPDTDPITPPDTDPVMPPDTYPITPSDTDPVTPPETDTVTDPIVESDGDINGDGKVNSKDLTRLMKHIAGEKVELSGSADINGDGKVNSKDLTRLMKTIAGE